MILALIAPALAWDSVGATWPAESLPIPYAVDAALGGGLDEEAALAAIQAGFQVWEDAGCGVSFAYEGRSADASFGGAADGQNVVFLLDEAWPEDSALVSTPALFTSGAEMVEADIALNGQTYAWATSGADGRALMDLQAGVTHEVGHLLGLWHSSVEGASLNPSMAGNPEARTLEDDDLEGLCALYGDVAAGEGALGETCVESADCAADLFCLADGADRYCSQSCEDDAGCPEGYACLDLGDGSAACAVELDKGGCGCASGGPAGGLGGLGIAGLALGAILRRRQPHFGQRSASSGGRSATGRRESASA